MKNRLILKAVTLCMATVVSVSLMSLTAYASHTHFFMNEEEIVNIVNIDNGYYHQVIHKYTISTCGCTAVKINTSHAGETRLEEHTFDSYSNGYPKCSECGYVEYAPYLP